MQPSHMQSHPVRAVNVNPGSVNFNTAEATSLRIFGVINYTDLLLMYVKLVFKTVLHVPQCLSAFV